MPNEVALPHAQDSLLGSGRRTVRSWWYRPQSLANPYNIGDETTSFVLDKLFDITAERVELPQGQIVGAGSILQNAWNQKSAGISHVVGAGFVMPQLHRQIPPHLAIHSVRGYLTRESIDTANKSAISVGDPGLLVSEFAPKKPRRPKFSYGIIPHISALVANEWTSSNDHLPNSVKIDVRTLDIVAFIRAMQDCEIIVSQSLHGLIFADALGIPNTWVGDWDSPVRGGNNYKFFDYFSSVGRPHYLMSEPGVALSETSVLTNLHEPDSQRIGRVQADILEAFDAALTQIGEDPANER